LSQNRNIVMEGCEIEEPSASNSASRVLVSVVIPARNEASSMANLITEIRRSLSSYPCEIIVVDDASTDMTVSIARASGAKLISHQYNRGKGCAIKTGVQNAQGDIIVFLDGDGAHDPQEILQVIAPILLDKADLVIGSRRLPESQVLAYSVTRRVSIALTSYIISVIVSFLLPLLSLFKYPMKYTKITDCTSGFRAIKRESWQKLTLVSNGFQIETEMVYEAVKNRLTIAEVPICCYNHSCRRSYLSILRDMPKTAKLLIIKLLAEVRARYEVLE